MTHNATIYAEIDIEDCNFLRQKVHQKLDKQTEKEIEEKSRNIRDYEKRLEIKY